MADGEERVARTSWIAHLLPLPAASEPAASEIRPWRKIESGFNLAAVELDEEED